jgi:hypothetical protein
MARHLLAHALAPLYLRLIGVAMAVGLCSAFYAAPDTANALDHNVYLPYVPGTPLMQQVIHGQEHVYCLDARASAYPNFRAQLQDVNAQYEQRVGIRSRETSFGDAACQVRHTMPDGISCSGWAARIYYASWPVTVEYCWPLAYGDWRSAQGHELGHGLLGLHEMYRDSGGSIGCLTDRTWTVMSCGTGVRYPQAIDVERGCALIATVWCGRAPEPEACNPCWRDDVQRWQWEDGWSFEPGPNTFWNPDGQREWTTCNADRLRWNFQIESWLPENQGFFRPPRSYWSFAPSC